MLNSLKRKSSAKILKILLWSLATLTTLLVAAFLVLQIRSVQTFLAKKTAQYLSAELHMRIDIDGLYIIPFESLALTGLYIQDSQKDTLLYAPKFNIDLNFFSLQTRSISIKKVQLSNSKFYLKKFKDNTTNLDSLIDYFSSEKQKPQSKLFEIVFDKIILDNITFKYKAFGDTTQNTGIDFGDLTLSKLSAHIFNFDTKNHFAKAQLMNLTFQEKCGFYLKNLTTRVTIDSNRMEFKNLLFETKHTRIDDYLLMTYHSFKDFEEFISKVFIHARFKNTQLYSADVAYFLPDLFHTSLNIGLNGTIRGSINYIKAKKLAVKIGSVTYLKGDFNIKGLPVLHETFLDLNLDQAFTNKQDLDEIIARATGKKDSLLPDIVQKLGSIHFKGRFTGFSNDFIALGEFKTRLGRAISDVNMKIDKEAKASYSGKINLYDFDVGQLFDVQQLERTSLQVQVIGQGLDANHIIEQAEGEIAYLSLNGYQYSNIVFNGAYQQKEFNGKLHVNDKNLKLSFLGQINLHEQLPVFKFSSIIKEANLRELKLSEDTLAVGAELTADFSGNNLDNIQGNFNIQKILLGNSTKTAVVNFVQVMAAGLGYNRSLLIKSDILDAGIHGEYDLNTLPAYFLRVVKKYIPALKSKISSHKPQNFDFTLKVKNFDPITTFFTHTIKIPYGAIANGKFSSKDTSVSFSAHTKLIEYNHIKVKDLIIDQSATPADLNMFITANRVDLNNDLFIKNVNIANIFRDDSLSFNIKLSDKSAENQLDLNGLVEFRNNADSEAMLSLLPSDVIIDRHIWKLQEKTHLIFNKDKIIVAGFGLCRNSQLLSVNGVVSSDPDDQLIFSLSNFKLNAFDPITRNLGIHVEGELNGQIILSNLKKRLSVQSNMTVDQMKYNHLDIGDLFLKTDLDHVSKLIAIEMGISKGNIQTTHLIGTYSVNENNLNTDLKIRNIPVAILQPFLDHLVSDLSGDVSANVKVTGQLAAPKVSGMLSLEAVGLTVNYLKTHYKMSNDLTVNNNIISLSNFSFNDVYDNKATVEIGSKIDLNDLGNPKIYVSLHTDHIMALHTAASDNMIYYGTAFATGKFDFYGPVDNMHIKINAKTEPGSVFNIPLNSPEIIKNNNLVTFLKKDELHAVKKNLISTGLSMNLDLQVNENTEVNIYTSLGKLSGRGHSAQMSLIITNSDDFNMFGDYQITQGKFHFSARDIVKKVFEISPESNIRWIGDPLGATIRMKTTYLVRANLKPLYIAAGKGLNEDKRVVVEAVMNLNGSLLNPDILFNLRFPNDSYVQDQLQAYLSDFNNTNQQALSLIVQRGFIALSGGNNLERSDPNKAKTSSGISNAGGKLATELALNRGMDILANALNLRFVDLNIRSLNDYSASVHLLDDRLILTGGFTDNRPDIQDYNFIGSSVSRDVEARYLIKKDGSLAAKVSNKPVTKNILNLNDPTDSQYMSAFGLTHSREFDNFSEFIRSLIGKKRKKERPVPREAAEK